jgi:hypothetical protein
VSYRWLSEKFPFDELLPAEIVYGDPEPPTVKQVSPHQCSEFTSRRRVPVLSALLGEVGLVLTMADKMMPLIPGSGGKGGQRPLVQRQCMLANLATCWHTLGKTPTAGPESDFTAFCEGVFDAIGWPTDSVLVALHRVC